MALLLAGPCVIGFVAKAARLGAFEPLRHRATAFRPERATAPWRVGAAWASVSNSICRQEQGDAAPTRTGRANRIHLAARNAAPGEAASRTRPSGPAPSPGPACRTGCRSQMPGVWRERNSKDSGLRPCVQPSAAKQPEELGRDAANTAVAILSIVVLLRPGRESLAGSSCAVTRSPHPRDQGGTSRPAMPRACRRPRRGPAWDQRGQAADSGSHLRGPCLPRRASACTSSAVYTPGTVPTNAADQPASSVHLADRTYSVTSKGQVLRTAFTAAIGFERPRMQREPPCARSSNCACAAGASR